MNTVRLLGVVQVLVIVSYFITEGLLASAVGSGSISDMLVNISKKLTLARIGNLAALGQTLIIVALGVLYYVVFYKEYKIIALVALGCFSSSNFYCRRQDRVLWPDTFKPGIR